MGYWDCPTCGNKGIKGTLRECPNCGAPRNESVEFYMKEVTYLTPEEAEGKGKGADWRCSFCRSLNSVNSNFCESCGASKEASDENYFTLHEKNEEKKREQQIKNLKKANAKTPTISKKNHVDPIARSLVSLMIGYVAVFALIAIVIIGAVLWNFIPHNKTFHCNETSWKTVVEIEEFKTVNESDWSIPYGGRETSHREEIHHYDKVLDHYRTVTKSKRVLDGYDTYTSYENNGDGTYTEVEHSKPRYRTEHYTEEEPVYKDVPVYKTKYYYDIDKWTVVDKLENKGKNNRDVTYEKSNLPKKNDEKLGKKREGKSYVNYYVTGYYKKPEKVVTLEVKKEIWEAMEAGEKYKLQFKGSRLQKIL